MRNRKHTTTFGFENPKARVLRFLKTATVVSTGYTYVGNLPIGTSIAMVRVCPLPTPPMVGDGDSPLTPKGGIFSLPLWGGLGGAKGGTPPSGGGGLYPLACSAYYTTAPLPTIIQPPVQIFCIGTLTPQNPADCAGSTGSMTIGIINGTVGELFDVRLVGSSFVQNNVALAANNTLTINNIPAQTNTTGVEITRQAYNYVVTKDFQYTFSTPAAPAFSVSFVEPACNGTGTVQISLDNAVAGQTYKVRINNGAAQPLQAGLNLVGGFAQGSTINQVLVKNTTTQCQSSQSFAYTFGSPTPQIVSVSRENPSQCGGGGKVFVQMASTADENYTVWLVYAGGYEMPAYNVQPPVSGLLTIPSQANGFMATHPPILGVKVKRNSTGCEVTQTTNLTFTNPAPPQVIQEFLPPPGTVCGQQGYVVLKMSRVGNYEVRYRISNGYYPLTINSYGSDMWFSYPLQNGQSVIDFEIRDLQTNCSIYYTLQNGWFTYTSPTIRLYNVILTPPSSCTARDGRLRVVIDQWGTNPTLQLNELFDMEVWYETENMTAGNFASESAYNLLALGNTLEFPHAIFGNGDRIRKITLTRRGNGSTIQYCRMGFEWSAAFSLPGYPIVRDMEQNNPEKCEGSLKLRVKMVEINPAHSYSVYLNGANTPQANVSIEGNDFLLANLADGLVVNSVKVVNETLGCTSKVFSKTINIYALPTLTMGTPGLQQPYGCGGKGQIHFEISPRGRHGYEYDVYLNEVLLLPNQYTYNFSSIYLFIPNLPEWSWVRKIKIVSKTTNCSAEKIFAPALQVKSLTPLLINNAIAEPIQACDGSSNLIVNLTNAEDYQNYELIINGNITKPFVFDSNPMYFPNFQEGFRVRTLQVRKTNSACTSEVTAFNLLFESISRPKIGEVTASPVSCGQSNGELKIALVNGYANTAYDVFINDEPNPRPNTSTDANKVITIGGFAAGVRIDKVKVLNRGTTCGNEKAVTLLFKRNNILVQDVSYTNPADLNSTGTMTISLAVASGQLPTNYTVKINLLNTEPLVNTTSMLTIQATVTNGNQLVINHSEFKNKVKVTSFELIPIPSNEVCASGELTDWDYTFYVSKPCLVDDIGNPIMTYPANAKLNYVRTTVVLKEGIKTEAAANALTAGEDAQISTQYFDGLGRPIQTVAHRASPQRRDIVQPIVYDEFGRNPKAYLPYTIGNASATNKFRYQALGEQCDFYNNEPTISSAWTQKPWAETEFEASPLNRVLRQGAAGQDWQLNTNNVVSSKMRINVDNEVLDFGLDGSGNPIYQTPRHYAAKEIIVNELIDEKGNQIDEYKDKGGKVLLKRTYQGSGSAKQELTSTYYVYDVMDRLRAVIQPRGLDSPWYDPIPQFTFVYKYDQRGRLVEKYVPGTGKTETYTEGAVYSVYDKLDRVILSQDGNQRRITPEKPQPTWTYVKYDALGRMVMSGTLKSNQSRADLQSAADAASTLFENRTSESSTGTGHGYTNRAFPSALQSYVLTCEAANYFDSYEGQNLFTVPVDAHAAIQGKPTFSKTAILDSSPAVWEYSITFYDRKGRVTSTQHRNAQAQTDITTNTYDFSGKVLQTKTTHRNLEVKQAYTYDHAGRLRALDQTVSSSTASIGQYQGISVRLAQYNYNELGQLSNKKLHRNGAGEFIQSMTFDYNIRGWLLALNGGKLSGTAQNGNLFAFALHYNTLNNSLIANGVRQYNGNIAAQTWISRRDNTARGFTYEYDNLNRLVLATFVSANATENNNYNTATTYDKNGNINSMYRRGVTQLTTNANGLPDFTYDIMDNMAYSYEKSNNSNRLSSVYDYATSQRDLPDFDNGENDGNTPDYAYDDNGNLIKDLNKKIEKIAYNRLNLPSEVVFTGKGKIIYSYNAAGVKLSKTVEEVGKPTKIMTYANGFLYENGELKEFGTAEGRMVFVTPNGVPPSGVRGLFQYHYKDHLGNVRMTFAPDVPVLETQRLSFETDSLSKETKNFTNVTLTRTAAEGHKNSAFVGKLDRQKGQISSKVLAVKQGEKLAVEVFAKYDLENLPIPFSAAKSSKIKGLDVLGLVSVADLAVGSPENKAKMVNFNLFGLLPIAKKLAAKAPQGTKALAELQPQAYLQITTYKDSLLREVLTEKRLEIGAAAQENWLQVADSLVFSEDGFAVVSLKNNSDLPVLFDNLELKVYGTEKAVIIQENHYEPFGMTLKGLDYVLNEKYKNQQLFGGKELTEDLGLEGYDFVNRGYNMQTGRFEQVDPLAENGRRWSPFVYCFNNPMRYIDPDGMWAGDYYDNSGRYLGSDGEKDNRIWLTSQENYNKNKGNVSDLQQSSREVEVKDKEATEVINAMYNESGTATNDASDDIEHTSFVVLDTKNATLSLRRNSDLSGNDATTAVPESNYLSGGVRKLHADDNLVVIANFHTHPGDPKENNFHPAAADNDYGNVKLYGTPTYTIDQGFIDKTYLSPSDCSNCDPNPNQALSFGDNYAPTSNALNGSFSLLRDAIKTNGVYQVQTIKK